MKVEGSGIVVTGAAGGLGRAGVDDAEPNVLRARVVGMRGFLHKDPATTTRAALAALIPHLTLTPTGATA